MRFWGDGEIHTQVELYEIIVSSGEIILSVEFMGVVSGVSPSDLVIISTGVSSEDHHHLGSEEWRDPELHLLPEAKLAEFRGTHKLTENVSS